MAKDKEKPTSNNQQTDIWKDARFQHLVTDPRFKRLPKSQRKVKIDKRFQSMFTDKKFNVKYTIDKYGRRMRSSAADDLRKYYELDSSATDDDDFEKDTEEQREEERAMCRQSDESAQGSHGVGNDGDDDLETDGEGQPLTLSERLFNPDIDYARGQGQPVTDSSDDESSDEDEEEPELLLEHVWGELDNDAEPTEESTRRLAVCNMDWDRIRAVDLMVLLNSFLPPGGSVLSVKIYPSEYGKERMAEEERYGPPELRHEEAENSKTLSKQERAPLDSDDSEEELVEEQDSDAEEGDDYHMEKLRQYQLNRLRYYYAVVECDSIETADKIYQECDGLEYESSATRIDLRFIPDDTTFDEADVADVCAELPDSNTYKPRQFTTTALQQAKVDLTWDETAVERREIGDKLLAGNLEEVDDADLRKLVAFSSEESDSDQADGDNDCGEYDNNDQGVAAEKNGETKGGETKQYDDAVNSTEKDSKKGNVKAKNKEKLVMKTVNKEHIEDTKAEPESKSREEDKSSKLKKKKKKVEEDTIARYKALLADIKEQEQKEKEERNKCQIEVTWEFGAGDDNSTDNDTHDDNEESYAKSKSALTPIEKVILKRSEKNKKRKEMRKKKRKEALSLSDADHSDSDDSIPDDIDMNDPYFAEEFQNGDFLKPKSKKKKKEEKQKRQKLLKDIEDGEEKRKEQELQLLLEDDLADSGKKHFSLEKILEAENETKSKRKRKKLLKKSKSIIAAEQKDIEDIFQIDLNDQRFSAIYSSHHFNIDPTHSHFKKTKGMEKIIQEKLKRRHGVDDVRDNGGMNQVEGNEGKDSCKSEMSSTNYRENNYDSIEVKRPKKELENKLLVKSLKRKIIK